MSVDEAWLAAQGEDAALLYWASVAFPLENPRRVGVAVSGGSDSMAMLHLMARVAPQMGWVVHAVTVDHGLRPEAAAEAQFVADACAGLGVSHETLSWHRTASSGNLQDQAARARYGLIAGWARERGLTHIVVGHTANDQAETFVMGLTRRSGIDGLAGMRREWVEGDITFVRPFLLQERAYLRAYLERAGLAWIDDPSNDNDRFARVKIRKSLVHLARLGITTDVLADITLHLSQVQQALDGYCAGVARRILTCADGDISLDWKGFRTAEPEVRRRLLIAALRWVSSATYPPRSSAIAALEMAIWDRKDKTLSGCRIICSDAAIRIIREYKAVRDLAGAAEKPWDIRWQLHGPYVPGQEVRALGAEGLKLCPDWRATGIPRTSLLSSPAVWQGDTLIAAPLAGFNDAWQARIVADFHSCLVSH